MSAVKAIAADALILADGVLLRPLLLMENGSIARITTQDEAETPAGTLQWNGTVAAGFFDVHVHGAGGRDVMEGSAEAIATVGATLAQYGTTSFLATTVTTSPDRTLRSLEGIAAAVEREPPSTAAKPLGIHLEGPFLSHAKRGVHPPEYLQAPSTELLESFWQASRGHIRLMTIAPELPGAPDLIAYARSLGVRVSLGHSNATAAETRAGIAAGAASATHTFNAMRALDHREPGILGVVLDHDALYAELICDGIHTTPEAVRLWLRSKGTERAILVTDGMAATGMPNGRYKLGDLDVDVSNGTCTNGGVLAGSVLTMDRAVANVQRFTGIPLADAVRLATRNPATMLGLRAAELFAGSDASLSLFHKTGAFAGCIVRGTRVS